jgi:TrmH family RNA methyltransferase
MAMPSGNPPKTVTSAQNSRLKALRRALNQAELVDGLCGVDSDHLVREAGKSGAEVDTLFLAESRYGDVAHRERILAGLDAKDILLVPDAVLHSIVSTEVSQGVAALVRVPLWEPDHVLAQQRGIVIVCAGLQDPGNFGTILRSGEAFAAAAVVAMAGTVSQFNPKAMRASAGSVFRLPVLELRGDVSDAVDALRQHGFRLIAADSHRGELATQIELRNKAAIFIGNEGAGVPRAVAEVADGFVRIPHVSTVESLNAGIAASLLLYESYRQRLR